ncbi:MAG: hypothetical protein RBT55_17105, partial [Rhodocyclaceae bacterium]|nr:hypothetical protein [Rhodocyclaceae bacterium]
QGGKFGHGFVSAGVTAGAAPYVSSNIVAGTATSAIIGGTVSEMTGGKFANGARSGAFAYVVMIGAHKIKSAVYEKSSIPAQHLYGSKDPYVDISHYDKVATALDVVFMTCADCDVPKLFSIEDMGDKATAATNVFTRHVTFNSRMLDFSEPSAAQLFLGTAYHETMHRANGFFRRFGDGFIDGVDNIANRGWTTGNHEMIYTRSAILAQQYISLYLRRLDSTRLVDQ